MADHDGHTINLGREAVDHITSNNCDHPWGLYCPKCDPLSMAEVDRLRAENTALAAALADLAEAVKAIPRHYPYDGPEVEDVTGKCLVCGTSWPCPTERAHSALDALEATDG